MTNEIKKVTHKSYVLNKLIDFLERYQDDLINIDVDENVITYNSFVYVVTHDCDFEFGGIPLFTPVTISFQRDGKHFSITANSKGVEFSVITGTLHKTSIDGEPVDCVYLNDVLQNLKDAAKVTYDLLDKLDNE